MPKTLNISLSISGEAVNIVNPYTLTNNAIRRYELPVAEFPALASNKEILATLTVAQTSAVIIVPTVNAVLKTNSTTTPGNTITLVANQGIVWYAGIGTLLSSIFTVDVTALYFTSSDTTNAGSVNVVILDDATF